jgi:hypothetical protein
MVISYVFATWGVGSNRRFPRRKGIVSRLVDTRMTAAGCGISRMAAEISKPFRSGFRPATRSVTASRYAAPTPTVNASHDRAGADVT